jgi:SH3 domain-containing protein
VRQMIRHAAAIAFVMGATSAPLLAQGIALTVTAASANVHKSPSTGSPVVGRARHGAILDVTRELGSWVKIAWPDAPDGVGFVHVSMGTIDRRADADRRAPATPPRPTETARPAPAAPRPAARVIPAEPPVLKRRVPAPPPSPYVMPPTHLLGAGGLIGPSAVGYGASARLWQRNRVGAQIELSRFAADAVDAPGRVSSVRLEPSVIYSPKDHVSDDLWLRPYVGSGLSVRWQTLRSDATLASDAASDRAAGAHVFGGAELTLPSVPRVALSAEVGYRWPHAPFAGVNLGGIGVSIAAHWYVR